MPVFAQLQPASFFGYPFMVEEVEVIGSIRDHLHEYPHSPGAAIEKLGRRLYTIRMNCNFGANFPKYPGLWPQTLSLLRKKFEFEETGPLVVPTIGTIDAYCRNWTQTMTNKVSSGERANFEFVEDQDDASLVSSLISVDVVSTQRKVDDYKAKFDAAKAFGDFANDKKSESLFDAIANAANALFAIGDQIELSGNLLSAKLDFLINLFDQVDDLGFTKEAANYSLIDAVHELWRATIDARQSANGPNILPLIWVVPATMSMSMVSTSLYGDTSHTVELMQLNVVPNLFEVRAGTRITYVPTS